MFTHRALATLAALALVSVVAGCTADSTPDPELNEPADLEPGDRGEESAEESTAEKTGLEPVDTDGVVPARKPIKILKKR